MVQKLSDTSKVPNQSSLHAKKRFRVRRSKIPPLYITSKTNGFTITRMFPTKQAGRPNFWKLPFGDHGRVPYGITVHVIGSQGWSRHCVFTTCHVWPCLVDTFKNSLLAAISTSLWKATSFDKINVIHTNFKRLSAPSKKVVSKASGGHKSIIFRVNPKAQSTSPQLLHFILFILQGLDTPKAKCWPNVSAWCNQNGASGKEGAPRMIFSSFLKYHFLQKKRGISRQSTASRNVWVSSTGTWRPRSPSKKPVVKSWFLHPSTPDNCDGPQKWLFPMGISFSSGLFSGAMVFFRCVLKVLLS